MTLQQLSKIWTVVGLFLLYYAMNSWIVVQGGQEIFGAKLQQPGPHSQRVRIRRPDGQLRHINSQWMVQFDPQQRPLPSCSKHRDE